MLKGQPRPFWNAETFTSRLYQVLSHTSSLLKEIAHGKLGEKMGESRKSHFVGPKSKSDEIKWRNIIILLYEPLLHNPDCTSIPKWAHF